MHLKGTMPTIIINKNVIPRRVSIQPVSTPPATSNDDHTTKQEAMSGIETNEAGDMSKNSKIYVMDDHANQTKFQVD